MNHPLLQEDEKFLWLWLATQSANNIPCSFNYEQISSYVNKPPKVIHRILFRLRIMGFLQADIPIWYAEPTKEMVSEIRTIRIMIPPTRQIDPNQVKAVVLPLRKSRRLNLLKVNSKAKIHNKAHKRWWGTLILKAIFKWISEYPYLRAKIWKALTTHYF